MPESTPPPPSAAVARRRDVRSVLRSVVAAAASLALGALTFVAQGALPDAVAPFANSASGWTVLTALLVFWSRARPGVAALLGDRKSVV